jgi:hypothetical protein
VAHQVRRVEVYVVLASDFEAMQFLATLGRLRLESGKGKSIAAEIEYKFGQGNRVVEVKAKYCFLSWKDINEIRKKLQRHHPADLMVFCPDEDIEYNRAKPKKKHRKRRKPAKR